VLAALNKRYISVWQGSLRNEPSGDMNMAKTSKYQQQKPGQLFPTPSNPEEVIKQKQEAEAREVAGRHKGDGQKDHKGAR